jgi:hypothetical protein
VYALMASYRRRDLLVAMTRLKRNWLAVLDAAERAVGTAGRDHDLPPAECRERLTRLAAERVWVASVDWRVVEGTS